MKEQQREFWGDQGWGQDPAYQVVDAFFQAYLVQRDVDRTLALVSEDIFSIGTGEHEVAVGKEAMGELLREEMGQMPQHIPYRICQFHSRQRGEGCMDALCTIEAQVKSPDNVQTHYRMRVSASLHREGEGWRLDTIHSSVASHHQQEREYFPLHFVREDVNRISQETQHKLLELMGQTMPGGIIGCYVEEGYPIYLINEQMLQMLRCTYAQLREYTGGEMLQLVHPEDRDYALGVVTQAIQENEQYEMDYRMLRGDGTHIWVRELGRSTSSVDGRHAVISVLMDISEEMRTREALKNETVRDPLTGLLNRRGCQERVQVFLDESSHYLYLMMDLDNFKQVNDTYGHAQGDQVLQFLADQLRRFFRKSDILCRMGGDEFVIFIPDCTAREVIEGKIRMMCQQYRMMMDEFYPGTHCSLSVGGVWGWRRRPPVELYRLADKMLYQVKQMGKGQVAIRDLDG